jgi:hypothetical protein
VSHCTVLGKEGVETEGVGSVLRRIFGSKRVEVGSWKKQPNDELHLLFISPSIVRVITWSRMRWVW